MRLATTPSAASPRTTSPITRKSPAAIYIDEVYISQMAGLAFSLFDIDRVEVLRGPQGTLFGRNATGGLANFITRKPTSIPSPSWVNICRPT